MNVSLKDLANICGCSVTSVSRALKDSDTISKGLREKVQTKAKELGYIPNLLAGSMRTGFTNSIAVILPDLRNPFFSILANYMEDYASSKGYSIFFMSTNEVSSHEQDAIIKAMQKNVDGILLLPNQQDTQSIDLLNKKHYPYVILGRIFENIKADYVVADDKKGAYLATQHLISKGHKNILFLNSYMYIYSSVERLEGYKKALEENGLEFNIDNVKTISTRTGDTERIVHSIFKQKNNYSAIYCYCDVIAFEAVYTLSRMGFNIPNDIAVAGADNIHSDIILPIRITSAGINREEYAKSCIDILIENIKNPVPYAKRNEFVKKVIDVELAIGQTT